MVDTNMDCIEVFCSFSKQNIANAIAWLLTEGFSLKKCDVTRGVFASTLCFSRDAFYIDIWVERGQWECELRAGPNSESGSLWFVHELAVSGNLSAIGDTLRYPSIGYGGSSYSQTPYYSWEDAMPIAVKWMETNEYEGVLKAEKQKLADCIKSDILTEKKTKLREKRRQARDTSKLKKE